MVVAVSQQRREEGGEGCDSGRVRVAWLRHGGAERKKEKGAILGGEGGAVAMWQRRKEGGKWCNTGERI